MSREFNVPPVIFPSAAGATVNPPYPQSQSQQRRPTPTPQFNPANPSIPFMSFDIDAASAAASAAATTTLPFSAPSFIGSGGSLNFDAEPPLLEELGINTKQIMTKTISILNPFRVKPHLHEDADLSGPFVVLLGFGLFQLLAGKFHFGIILGWVTVAAIWLYVVFHMLSGGGGGGRGNSNGSLDLHRCVSLIGYCMLPMAVLSGLVLFVPRGGGVVFGLAGVFVVWSTRVCTKLLVEVSTVGDEHKGLIAYACFLIYALFALLIVF